ncbi:signal transduction histidine kinase [Lactobacillus casei str. Zhang] [Lacticaseibacillus rhamnosus]|nr:signal transduction histidine kinase [Lactobacillus casei str. Zhang] [Lacticaseibacillus rhamnosus]
MVLRSIEFFFFFLMIRRPPRSTPKPSSAASDVYKRQGIIQLLKELQTKITIKITWQLDDIQLNAAAEDNLFRIVQEQCEKDYPPPVSYTHLRAHETVLDLVCRLLLEKKKKQQYK